MSHSICEVEPYMCPICACTPSTIQSAALIPLNMALMVNVSLRR